MRDETVSDSGGRRVAWLRLFTAGIMGVIIGGILALMFSTLGGSGVMFLAGFVGGGYYLYRKPLATAALGTGLYISAALIALTPIFYYLPLFVGAEEGTAEGAGQAIGSLLGLLIWGFVFLIIGLVVFAGGYFLNRRARRKLDARDNVSERTGPTGDVSDST